MEPTQPVVKKGKFLLGIRKWLITRLRRLSPRLDSQLTAQEIAKIAGMKKQLRHKSKSELINFVLNYEIIIRNIAHEYGYPDGEAIAKKFMFMRRDQ